MVKAKALRKRYIAFKVRSGTAIGEEELKHSLYKEALKFFGEYLLSFVALKLVSFDSRTSTAIIRCSRDFSDESLGFLALVSSLNGKKARTIAIATSGTIKGVQKKCNAGPVSA
jgi:RNase P/RNase MRP subunit POP5